jgi:hypothetical protein
MLTLPTERRFHQMVETIDLTLSDSEESDAHRARRTPSPCYMSLPLRCTQAIPQPLHKRTQEDSLGSFPPLKRAKKKNYKHCSMHYPGGVFKQVRVLGHIRPDDITLPEVLDVPSLHEAVVSSFAWDMHWLLSDIGLGWVKTTFIADYREQHAYALQAQQACLGSLNTPRWHVPPHNAKGCAHSKLMLLFRKDGIMRIAIPTGNLRRADWGAPAPLCGQLLYRTEQSLDNLVFIIDLPLQGKGVQGATDSKTAF